MKVRIFDKLGMLEYIDLNKSKHFYVYSLIELNRHSYKMRMPIDVDNLKLVINKAMSFDEDMIKVTFDDEHDITIGITWDTYKI